MGRIGVGAAFGATIGALYLVAGVFAFVPLVVAVVWVGAGDRPRIVGGGMLTGFGAAWLAMFAVATVAGCGTTSAGGCTAPDLTPWVVLACAIIAVGVALIVFGLRGETPSR
jgi:hypothetical protein